MLIHIYIFQKCLNLATLRRRLNIRRYFKVILLYAHIIMSYEDTWANQNEGQMPRNNSSQSTEINELFKIENIQCHI